jgi:hypothetical protein
MINSLTYAYQKVGENNKVKELEEIKAILE